MLSNNLGNHLVSYQLNQMEWNISWSASTRQDGDGDMSDLIRAGPDTAARFVSSSRNARSVHDPSQTRSQSGPSINIQVLYATGCPICSARFSVLAS
jgi:hypothetical protein